MDDTIDETVAKTDRRKHHQLPRATFDASLRSALSSDMRVAADSLELLRECTTGT